MMLSILTSPSWFAAMRRYGVPRLASFKRYAPDANLAQMTEFVRKQARPMIYKLQSQT